MLQPLSQMPIWARLMFKEQVESLYYWDMYLGNPDYGDLTNENEDWVAWPDVENKNVLPMFFTPVAPMMYLDGLYDERFVSCRSIHDVTVKGFERTSRLSSHRPEDQLIVSFSMDWIIDDEFKPYCYQFLVVKT